MGVDSAFAYATSEAFGVITDVTSEDINLIVQTSKRRLLTSGHVTAELMLHPGLLDSM